MTRGERSGVFRPAHNLRRRSFRTTSARRKDYVLGYWLRACLARNRRHRSDSRTGSVIRDRGGPGLADELGRTGALLASRIARCAVSFTPRASNFNFSCAKHAGILPQSYWRESVHIDEPGGGIFGRKKLEKCRTKDGASRFVTDTPTVCRFPCCSSA